MKLSTIDTLATRRARLGREILQYTNTLRPLTPEERRKLHSLTREVDQAEDDLVVEARRKHDSSFASFLRHGAAQSPFARGVTPEERAVLQARDMALGNLGGAYPGSSGGFFASLEFNSIVTSALKSYSGVISSATIADTVTSAPRSYPSDNDTSVTGRLATEASQVTEEDVQGLSQVMLGAFRFDSTVVKISREFVEDSGIDDLQEYIGGRLGIRLARILNQKFSVGIGTTEPLGLVNAAAVGATANGSAGNDGVGGPGTIGSDDLANLEASVDPAYRANASYMLHSNSLSALRKVKTKDGLPVFPGLSHGGENTLLNYPVVINNDMAQIQTGPNSPPTTGKTVLFGRLESYVIRRAPLFVQRLDERYADFGQIGFLAWWRCDGNLIDGGGGAVKALENVY